MAHTKLRIGLSKMRFYAYHGVHAHENEKGTEFEVDIMVDYEGYSGEDDLSTTFDYSHIYDIASAEMRHTSKLIEAVGHRIGTALMNYDGVSGVSITIRKKNPPIDGHLHSSIVEIII